DGVCKFLFSILNGKINKGVILDPCVGNGALLKPFLKAGYDTIGIDIIDQGFEDTICQNFLTIEKGKFEKPALVIANPPFNIDDTTKALASEISGARPLLPEVWLQKIIHLWGIDIPICLFAPYGLRLNQTLVSKRWRKFVEGVYPPISSIIALPKDIYKNVLFHSEILVFNVKNIEPHYFYHIETD
ncbi:MAG: SAM-dependent methyltransferase, partial [Pseudomonadota bacterium]